MKNRIISAFKLMQAIMYTTIMYITINDRTVACGARAAVCLPLLYTVQNNRVVTRD